MPLSLIPFALLVVPVVEIAVFILVGGQIGVLPTLALVVLTAVIGTILLRRQGLGLIRRIQAELDAGRVPGRDLAHGAMLLAAGILLLTPGFVTDTLGFLLFIPAVRDRIAAFLVGRMRMTVIGGDRPQRRQARVVELDPADYSGGPADPHSPWRADQPR